MLFQNPVKELNMNRNTLTTIIGGNAIRVFVAAIIGWFAFGTDAMAEQKESRHPSRIIQYRGYMPQLRPEKWGQTVQIKFELYRSPNGGTPYWRELRDVDVQKNGWVEVDLGEVEPLPDDAFKTPFRFLSIWHETHEFIPRKQVASLTYVASRVESQLKAQDYESYEKYSIDQAKAAAAKAPGRENRLDKMVSGGGYAMEKHPRMPMNWLDAVAEADRIGARLPTFEEWYGAYDGEASKELVGMEGHYEWVIPWVYEPTIHARLHELYRGKPVACYYNELSPLNDYPFRLAIDEPESTEKAE